MDTPANFEAGKNYARFRPVGQISLNQAVDLISEALAFCVEKRIARLLVSATGLTGFGVPGTFERYSLSTRFASIARSRVKVVLVVNSEMIDPNRFGVTVAKNRGLNANVFSVEEEAIAWLLAQ
jgi:hypothetical protein